MTTKSLKLSIVIPTYNESRTIRDIIKHVNSVQYPIPYEIIIVDDASIDRTYDKEMIIRIKDKHKNIKLYRNRVNRGKGACVRQGITHSNGDIIIIQDADLEYDPKDIPKLLSPIINNQADAVYGSRFLLHKWPEGMAFPNLIGNKILTKLTNLLFGTKITDEATCYKMARSHILKSMNLKSEKFTICPEITSKLAKRKVKIVEIPINYHGRTAKEGKKIKAKDFIAAVFTLIYNRFSRST